MFKVGGVIIESNSNANRRKEIVAYLLLICTAVIWGGTWPIGRWLVSEEVGGATIPPFMIAFIRYFLAVICFFIILRIKEGTLNWQFAKENWKILTFMGLTSVTIYQAGYLIGEIFTAASDASIMVATNAIWVVILSSTFLKTEFFTWKKVVGTLMAFIAVIIVVGFSPNVDVLNRFLGDFLILAGAFAYAVYTVLSRHFLNKTQNNSKSHQPSSLWIISWVSFFGFLTIIPIALIISPQYLNPLEYFTIPTRIWFGIAYLAFLSSIIAYTFYLEGVKRLSASRAAIFQTLVPLFGVLFSAIFLQEEFDVFIYPFSLLLVIIGISLVNLKSFDNKGEKLKNFKK
ncbi:MAG: DMT family transporter [Candidatus Hodarchaeota archaeon]